MYRFVEDSDDASLPGEKKEGGKLQTMWREIAKSPKTPEERIVAHEKQVGRPFPPDLVLRRLPTLPVRPLVLSTHTP